MEIKGEVRDRAKGVAAPDATPSALISRLTCYVLLRCSPSPDPYRTLAGQNGRMLPDGVAQSF